MKVGRYFTAAEFGRLEGAELAGVGALCALFLDPLRERYGACRVISGKRTVAHNSEVGGAPESRHLYSRRPLEAAADVAFARGSPAQWASTARALSALYGRGGVGQYSGHLHVDSGPRRRW